MRSSPFWFWLLAALLPLLARRLCALAWRSTFVAVSAYSLYLKRVAIVDVLLLSGLYTLRLLAGGAATGTQISHWLAGFSSFLFLSLAMVKRFSELENMTRTRRHRTAWARLPGLRSGADPKLRHRQRLCRRRRLHALHRPPRCHRLYRHRTRLWLIVPLLIYWLNRVWLMASRGEFDDDPVVFAMRDPISLAVGAAGAAVALLRRLTCIPLDF